MSIINSQPLIGASGQGGYFLTKSLRFRQSASAYLNRTPASNGTRTTWTWSAWVKRGTLGSQVWLFGAGGTSNPREGLNFDSNNNLNVASNTGGSPTYELISSATYRDPSAWYHIVYVFDSTQATSSNRIKLYVNGVQLTAFGTATYPSQNANAQFINSTSTHTIGGLPNTGIFDGYMAEINFIDGQALTPSSFGETSTSTGVWIPKKYTGTYGTNGFYLPFTDVATTSGSNAGLGKDFSGNGNYWTTNNISVTSGSTYDSMKDVPTLTDTDTANYCALNPISNPNGTIVTYSDGNLAFSHSASSGNAPKMTVQGTMALPANKTYWEYTVGATVNDQVGIGTMLVLGGSADGTAGARYINTGAFQSTYTVPSSGASYTTGDIIGMAYDQPNGTLAFYKNNSLQGTITNISTSEIFFPHRSVNSSGTGGAGVFNFGQRPFTYTPPTGFKALNTFNLPTPTIGATASTQASKYMNIVLYTGDNSSSPRSITGFGFSPDFVWVKARSNTIDHNLWNSVMGAGSSQGLHSNTTAAAGDSGNFAIYGYVSSLDSDGFTVTKGSDATYGNFWHNYTSTTYVAWAWDANGSGSTNTAGSITSTVSVNTTAGFSIVTYTGNGTGGATIGHGLGVAPTMMIFKKRNSTSSWLVWHTGYNSNQAQMLLDSTAAIYNPGNGLYFNSTYPSSTVATLGTSGSLNGSGDTYVAYMFTDVAGYSKFGSYTGNGSSDGPFIYTGFRPRFVLTKASSFSTASTVWTIWDTTRSPSNAAVLELYPNSSSAESTDSAGIDILSNGFKPKRNSEYANSNGQTYIYMAVAENPFKYSNAR